MRSKGYAEWMKALRNQEERPSFEKIRELVLAQQPARKLMFIPMWLRFSASALLGVMLVMMLVLNQSDRNNTNRNSMHKTDQSQLVATHALRSTTESRPITKIAHQIGNHSQGLEVMASAHYLSSSYLPRIDTVASSTADHDFNVLPNPNEVESIDKINPIPTAHSAEGIVKNLTVVVAKPQPVLVNWEEHTPERVSQFAAFFSGALPPFSVNIPFSNLIDGSIGLRYGLTSSSALVVEVRRNAFIETHGTSHTSYHDTTLTVGNQQYQNTIGGIATSSTESVRNAFSVGVGYRLTYSTAMRILPFGEVLFGAGVQGAISSEMAGVEWRTDSPFSIDLGVRFDQLFSRASAPEAALNFESSLSYAW